MSAPYCASFEQGDQIGGNSANTKVAHIFVATSFTRLKFCINFDKK
jgi:hypothetical protein